ncbi:hypothetical protein PCI56_05640 [Plesiomonas shigelloides subsp. oncorhynchi]|nr:hypothetical protein [Plesiomonas shigelloides]
MGRAIAENSASMYLLGQTEETVESACERSGRLSLSEGGFHTLRTVHNSGRVLRNLYQIEEWYGVGRLIVGDFQKPLYSTDPVDVNAIDQFVKQGLSIQRLSRL